VTLGWSVLPGHPAGEPLTHTHHRDEVVHGLPAGAPGVNRKPWTGLSDAVDLQS
jgi:hypothetical protein